MIVSKRQMMWNWMSCQLKYKVMFNPHGDCFQLRDRVNNIAVGYFDTHDDAVEFAYDLCHDLLAPLDKMVKGVT